MAKITEISVQKRDKNRASIYLDGVFYCGIRLETVYNYHLKTGMDISPEELENIQFDSEKSEALDKALGYVSKSMKTKRQVKDYLSTKGYLPAIVDYCMAKMVEYKFVDDDEYCKAYVRSYKKNKGAKLLEQELRTKGIDFNLIDKALDGEYDDGTENAKRIAEKYLKNKELTRENLQKAYRYLLSKGFSYEEINSALAGFKGEEWNEF